MRNEDAVAIDVSADPSAVAEALRLGRRRAGPMERVLADPSIPADAPEVRAGFAEDPATLAARLEALA